jgi:2-methylisocitrate lyase-like PEP mutase family enzyme
LDSQATKALRFAALHKQREILILPNAWDAASARIYEDMGFPAIGTTSAGIAFSLGYPDGEQAPWAEQFSVIRRIVRSVKIPVTADIEAGYGDLPAVIRDVIAAGIVGVNLEDAYTGPDPDDVLYSVAEQISRIRIVKRIADDCGIPLFLNARTDAFWLAVGPPDQRLQTAIDRVEAFVLAGADGVFVPGLNDPAMIAELTKAAGAPVNILGSVGVPPVPELHRLGVKRVSVGSGPMRSAMGQTRRVAEELRRTGTYDAITAGSVSYADANRLFADSNSGR